MVSAVMPFATLAELDDTDLAALYDDLGSLPARSLQSGASPAGVDFRARVQTLDPFPGRNDMSRTRIAIVAASAVTLALVSLAALAQPRTVSRVGLVVRPQAYSGSCPATFTFIGTIHVRHPARVEYQWERSDGGRGAREVVDIRGAAQGVRETWTLGAPGERRAVWMRLHVLAPTGISSPTVRVRLNCRR